MTIENLLIKNVNIVGSSSYEAVFTHKARGTSNILFKKVGIMGVVASTHEKYTCYLSSFIAEILVEGTTKFENCYARVNFGAGSDITAGIAIVSGSAPKVSANCCYWEGGFLVNEPNKYFAGSIFAKTGSGSFTTQNCYYDNQKFTIAQTNNGTGLTTDQMKQQGSYVGWDFENTWYMGEDGYPELKFEK